MNKALQSYSESITRNSFFNKMLQQTQKPHKINVCSNRKEKSEKLIEK